VRARMHFLPILQLSAA